MPRSYATTDVDMLLDADWIALGVGAKAVYEILRTQGDIAACGLLPLTLRRWSRALNVGDRPRLSEWLNELIAARFIVVDKDTEELLVRTFARWDGGYKNQKRRLSVVASANAVQSEPLRVALRVELAKLGMVGCPMPVRSGSGRGSIPVPSPIERGSIGVPSGFDPPSNGVPSPIDPRSIGVPSGFDPPSIPQGVWLRKSPPTRNQEPHSWEGSHPRSNADPPPPPEFCSKHPGGTDAPCTACGRARLTRNEFDAEQTRLAAVARDHRRRTENATRLAAITDCQLCGPDGYRLKPDGTTGAVCNHQPLNPGGLARARAATQEATT